MTAAGTLAAAILAAITVQVPHPIANASPTISRPRLVIALGDSITAGILLPSSTDAWPAQARVHSHGRFLILNAGISGNTLANATPEHPYGIPMQTRIRTLLARRPWAVVLLGGTNDLLWAHGTATEDEQAIADIARRTWAAHAQLIVSTVPPVGTQWAGNEADAARAALNTWIRRHFHGDHLIDFYAHVAVEGRLPLADQAAGDGVHPSAAVDAWFAEQVVVRLFRLVARP